MTTTKKMKTMDFEPTMRGRLSAALEALIGAAVPYAGLFPSILDRRSGRIPEVLPPPIPGQRNGDRAYPGSNLIHDEATLKTLYALSRAWHRPDYAAAADRYLHRFATHCTDTATGLFPWGEHSFWHLTDDRVGNSYVHDQRFETMGQHLPATHDHLRQAPLWLWEKLWEFNPRCVERFAEGLDFHWQQGRRDEYIRHANIEQRTYPTPYGRSCDFPRHGGFYIFDWAYAWSRTGRADFLDQIRDMLDYWWRKRDARGLLKIESRCPPGNEPDFSDINAPGQTVSLAASLLEAAELLEMAGHSALASTMRERAAVYVDGFLAAPHDLDRGVFVISARQSDNSVAKAMPIWGSEYGVWPASYIALTCLCVHRLTHDPRLLDWARAVAECYRTQAFPVATAVPAMDAGLGLGLLADLYDLTGEASWCKAATTLANRLSDIYLDAPLPRGAAGYDWYDAQMGPGFLLHGLARTWLLATDREACLLAADYTAR